MKDSLQEAIERYEQAERELEDKIVRIVKEYYWLSLPGYQEATTPDLEEVIIGRG